MYDTYVTIVGNALHEPEWRKTTNTGALVTTFKIASTSRRLNRETGKWVDGNSLRVRVNCWRALASNVKNSVTRGDPLIVAGRMFTREWEDEHGVKRLQYELEATAIGHDLSRGRAVFERVKVNTSTSVIEDAQAQQRIGGELTDPVPADEAPAHFNDATFDAVYNQPPEAPVSPAGGYGGDPVGALRGSGFTADPVMVVAEPDGLSAVGELPDDAVGELSEEPVDELADEFAAAQPGSGRRRGQRRSKVPA